MGTDCPECGEEYEQLGKHWRWNPDHRPELTQHQKEVISGLLMGDGCVNRDSKNPLIQCNMIRPNYLEYLDNIFGCLSTGVKLKHTAEENAQIKRDSGFSPNANAKDYSDLYIWRSRSLPELQEFADWYSSGKKVWPEDIELTPTVLKHWYCGDGSWNNSGSRSYVRIGMANEVENTDKVDRYFERANLPTPSNYHIGELKNCDAMRCTAAWSVEDSKKLWDYMGKPLPDFEYKWPEQFHNN